MIMSIIPKIKVGMPKKREKLNLDFDCSTTAVIGAIQPTMCREMVPNETFHVKVASLCRLMPLAVPTFGRMSMRHYHVFVPYRDIWEPFENMLSGQRYTFSGHASTGTYIPTATPFFTMPSIVQKVIMNYSEVSVYKGYEVNPENAVTFNPDGMTKAEAQSYVADNLQPVWEVLKSAPLFGGTTNYQFNKDGAGSPYSDDARGFINFGSWYFSGANSAGSIVFDPDGNAQNLLPFYNGGSVVVESGADFITSYGGYTFCFKLRPVAKRFRQVMIGLGYQFSPYSDVSFNPFKLIAYYKAWFELFRPVREKAYVDTNCYKLCHAMRDRSFNGGNVASVNSDLWDAFLDDLIKDCYYYLPMDYFAMATTSPQQANSDLNYTISTPVGANAVQSSTYTHDTSINSITPDVLASMDTAGGMKISPLNMRLAMRLLTWANKNTIIGRSVREWLKVHYGITGGDSLDSNGVVRIGSSRTNLQISDVMSTAQTEQGDLGQYAGRGIGYGDSEKFDYTAKFFGCWLTLTVIVPESGYYQGYLAENRHGNRYQFFQPEFDALGYQVLERGELIDDFNCDGQNWNPRTGFERSGAFGFVPRYSEYKVGRNIVNGDLSLPGRYVDMSPYTLDRRLPAGAISYEKYYYDQTDGKYDRFYVRPVVSAPGFVPSVVYDNFRRIDPTDHLGQYNRIFTDTTNSQDHFIINMVFSVDAIAPMKSLTTSFDTIEEDERTIDITHS